ncbi:MAG: phosphonate C-P lyase system protein PhnH, partial [Alphaproteobacteria bacterium]|nr:phosphonate C-P lyase system protein PhnH [Alphaproteobacteria bacterium]
ERDEAQFAVLAGGSAQAFEGFAIGTDPYPDRSATLVIEVPDLRGGPATKWRGPGIDGRASVAIAGLVPDFWREWATNHSLFPCGVDLVFTAGTELCALPRSIAVEV